MPFERELSFLTSVQKFFNGQEQRWASRAPLATFSLPMQNLLIADKTAWITATPASGFVSFTSAQGRRFQDLSLTLTNTLGSVTYSNLALMSDSLNQTNPLTLLYNQQLNLRQVSNSAWTPPTAPTTYPTFSFGGVAQQPLSQIYTFLVSVNDSVFGPRYAYSWYGSSLSNFPSTYLRMWRIAYPLLTDTDAATIESFFNSAQGRYYSFSFTDPIDHTAYPHVRFDVDALKFKYITRNQQSTEVTLLQTYNS
jgi:hypothetical protein